MNGKRSDSGKRGGQRVVIAGVGDFHDPRTFVLNWRSTYSVNISKYLPTFRYDRGEDQRRSAFDPLSPIAVDS